MNPYARDGAPVPIEGLLIGYKGTDGNFTFATEPGASGVAVPAHDYEAITYFGSTENINTITYKTGGSGGTTVGTSTFAYDGDGGTTASDRLISITLA